MFLCDRHMDAKLAPRMEAPERSLFLQTLVYFSSSVQTAFQLDYHAHRFADKLEDEPSAQRRGCWRLKETWQVIDDQIDENQWILGNQFSAADIYLFMLTTWLETSRGHPDIREFPNVQRIADAVMLRPSVQLVYEIWEPLYIFIGCDSSLQRSFIKGNVLVSTTTRTQLSASLKLGRPIRVGRGPERQLLSRVSILVKTCWISGY